MRSKLLTTVVLLSALCLMTACTNNTPQPSPKQETPTESNEKTVIIDDIEMTITATEKKYKKTELIPLRLRLLNAAAADSMLTFPTSQKYDFFIKDEQGHEVWRWSEGRVFTQMVQNETIQAGERFDYFGKVEPGELEAGSYEVLGLTTAEELIGETVSIELIVENKD